MNKSTFSAWLPAVLMLILSMAGGLLLARTQLAVATHDTALRQALAERPHLRTPPSDSVVPVHSGR